MKVRLVLFLVLAAMATSAEAQMLSIPGVVTTATEIRIDPSARVPLTTLPRGTDVTVLSVQEGWVQVAFEDLRYGRRVGYVPRTTVTFGTAGLSPAAHTPAPKSPAEPVALPAASPASIPDTRPVAAVAPPTPVKPTVTAARPPVRSVEAEFPSATSSSSPAPAAEPQPATRTVVSTEGAFPDGTVARSTAPVQPTASVVSEPRPSDTPAVAVVHAPVSVSRSAEPSHAAASLAMRAPVTLKRGMRITLMIPRALLKEDAERSSREAPAVAVDITAARGGDATVNGTTDWMRAGLPSLLEASIERVTREKDHTALKLQATSARGTDMVVTLRVAHSVSDPAATLGQLIVDGGAETPAALAYRKEAHTAVAEAVFAGDLKNLSDERKRAILATLQESSGAPDVHVHDGQLYASFELGVDRRAFNDRFADESAIVAYVLNETMLPEVRKMAKSLAQVPELRGMRVVYRIPHKAKPGAPEKQYRVELLADMRQVVAFAGAGLTNDAFVGASTLRVDGKPLEVDLEAVSPLATD